MTPTEIHSRHAGERRAEQISAKTRKKGFLYYDLFCLACLLPLADFALHWIGLCPDQPFSCTIPVAPGMAAPVASVVLIGLALCLRDLMQKELGLKWALIGMISGWAGFVFFSWLLDDAPFSVQIGGMTAWLIALLVDCAVWTALAARGRLALAAIASGCVGAIVDSATFLLIAYGNLHEAATFALGKIWIVLTCVLLFRMMGLFAPEKS